MKAVWIGLAGAALLSACAHETTTTTTTTTTTQTAPSGKTVQVTAPPSSGDVVVNTVSYACTGGVKLTVAFNDSAGTVTVTAPGAAPLTLKQNKTSDASFDYSDATHKWHGKHNAAVWTSGGTTVNCTIAAS